MALQNVRLDTQARKCQNSWLLHSLQQLQIALFHICKLLCFIREGCAVLYVISTQQLSLAPALQL